MEWIEICQYIAMNLVIVAVFLKQTGLSGKWVGQQKLPMKRWEEVFEELHINSQARSWDFWNVTGAFRGPQ